MAEAQPEGRRIASRYHLLEAIGRGGMGIVWRAHDELLDREVAIKEVRYADMLGEDNQEDFNRRTKREARAAGRLTHPNVVVVHDVVEEDGRPWIVMQLVESRSLGKVLRQDGPLPPRRVAEIGLQVLEALRAAHAQGVLHRDVKPENVLLADDGRVVLTDFGIATLEAETALTMTGIAGTPAFIPPERIKGGSAQRESDLWSLGATLYAAVEGRPPHDRGGALPTMHAILNDEPEPPVHAGPLAPVLEGLLRKDPALRMPYKEAARLLRGVAESGGDRDRPARTAVMPAVNPDGDTDPGARFRPGAVPETGAKFGAVPPASESTVPPASKDAVAPGAKGKAPSAPTRSEEARGAVAAPAGDPRLEPGAGEPGAGAAGTKAAPGSKAVPGEGGGQAPVARPASGASRPPGGVTPPPGPAPAAEPSAASPTSGSSPASGEAGPVPKPAGKAGSSGAARPTSQAGPDSGDTTPVPGARPGTASSASASPAFPASPAPSARQAPRTSPASPGAASSAPSSGGRPGASSGTSREGAPPAVTPAPRKPASVARPNPFPPVGREPGPRREPAAEPLSAVGAEAGRWEGPPPSYGDHDSGTSTLTSRGQGGSQMKRGLLVLLPALLIVGGVAGWLGMRSRENEGVTRARTGGPSASSASDVPGGGTAEATPQGSSEPEPSTPASSSPSTSPSPAATPSPTKTERKSDLPSGWRMHKDSNGFSIGLPKGWNVEKRPGQQVWFRGPDRTSFVFVEYVDRAGPDPKKDWEVQEGAARGNFPGYDRIGIKKVDYMVKAADWEFTWNTSSGKARVLNRGFVTKGGRGYAIYWHTLAKDWKKNMHFFEGFTATFSSKK